jgi:hypothetical protein
MALDTDKQDSFDDLILGLCSGGITEFNTAYHGIVEGGGDPVPRILQVIEHPLDWVQRYQNQPHIFHSQVDGVEARLIHDGALRLRQNLIEVLGEIGDRRAVPAIIAYLDDPANGLPPVQPVIPVYSQADESPIVSVPFVAIKALGQIGDERAIPALLKYLPNSDEFKTMSLIETLIGFEKIRSSEQQLSEWVTYLRTRLESTGSMYKDYAVKLLNKIGTPEALDAVRRWREYNQSRRAES